MKTLPLDGIRVLDLTSVVVGPAATLRLADYGADVIKLESPDGDLIRGFGGPSRTGKHSGTYLQFNRRKRAICIDIKRPEARTVITRLLDHCDVVVSNIRPSALARLGLDAKTVRASHPNIIHCTITGYGPKGPYRGRPAYDSTIQAAAGIAGLFSVVDGAPRYVPLLLCDHIVGEISAGSIIAALLGRERNGTGSSIEVPMYETMAAFVLQEHLSAQAFEPPLGDAGDARMLDEGHAPLRTADGWISVSCNTDVQVHAFLRVAGLDDYVDDPRFRTIADRMRNVRDWLALRNSALSQLPTSECLTALDAADIPAMPCHTLHTLLDDPHLSEVALLESANHPTEGAIRTTRPTILYDGDHGGTGSPAYPIGWNTREVLAEIGMEGWEIDSLVDSQVVLDGRCSP